MKTNNFVCSPTTSSPFSFISEQAKLEENTLESRDKQTLTFGWAFS